jgi:hypothetical protein
LDQPSNPCFKVSWIVNSHFLLSAAWHRNYKDALSANRRIQEVAKPGVAQLIEGRGFTLGDSRAEQPTYTPNGLKLDF